MDQFYLNGIKLNNITLAEFGNADNFVASSITTDGIGIITIGNIKQHSKAIVGERIKAEETTEPDIIMTFTNTESIDTVIKSLNIVKQHLEDCKPTISESNVDNMEDPLLYKQAEKIRYLNSLLIQANKRVDQLLKEKNELIESLGKILKYEPVPLRPHIPQGAEMANFKMKWEGINVASEKMKIKFHPLLSEEESKQFDLDLLKVRIMYKKSITHLSLKGSDIILTIPNGQQYIITKL